VTNEQLICLNDLMATCAELLGVSLPPDAGEDSVSILPLLRGSSQPVRQSVVHHSIDGRFALRDRQWKLVLCPGSGGWDSPTDPEARRKDLPPVQLYDMVDDDAEQANRQADHPQIVKSLTEQLNQIVDAGRSTPGPDQHNDVHVNLRKK
jgi:arylsulfatase A-like enzyme